MRFFLKYFIISAITLLLFSCKKNNAAEINQKTLNNSIQYAKGLEIYRYNGYSVVKVKNPWPEANKTFTYILQENGIKIPDSLKQYVTVQVPLKKVIATSTTHISSLAMLSVENTLVGFPNLNYISSPSVRKIIEAGKVKELGNNQTMNLEVAIDLAPSAIIGYGLDNNNPTIDNLQKSGLKVILNGDWNEQSPLGKAEWIKLFGALYGKEKEATQLFDSVVKEYQNLLKLVQKTSSRPTVMAGSMFEDVWYAPQGESWGARFLNDAGTNYLWREEKGTGGLPLSFEKVLDKAHNADFWIGPGEFNSLEEMVKSNPHYSQFKAFKTKKVYSYSLKKGKTGGLIYFEEAPNRPDLVLKDLVKITHPELLTNYQLHYFQKLN